MPLMPVSSNPSPRQGGTKEEKSKPLGSRRYTLSLSFAGLLTSGIVAIIAIGWIFAFGVIVGRGLNPEKQLPELAKLLPAPDTNATEPKENILKPEELTFMAELKNQPGKAPVSAGAAPSSAAPVTANKPAPAADKQPAPQKEASRAVRSDYLFQAVAYKNRDQADRLREKLEGEGLRTRMTIEKDSKGKPKWYRVQVLLRGTDEEAAAAKKIMGRFGVKDPKLVSQKALKK